MPDLKDQKTGPGGTFRQQLEALLKTGSYSCRDLSQLIHQSEKEVLAHLEHLRKSLKSKQMRLAVDPAVCRHCGFTFRTRNRLGKPGRCPECRQSSIEPPLYSIEET